MAGGLNIGDDRILKGLSGNVQAVRNAIPRAPAPTSAKPTPHTIPERNEVPEKPKVKDVPMKPKYQQKPPVKHWYQADHSQYKEESPTQSPKHQRSHGPGGGIQKGSGYYNGQMHSMKPKEQDMFKYLA